MEDDQQQQIDQTNQFQDNRNEDCNEQKQGQMMMQANMDYNQSQSQQHDVPALSQQIPQNNNQQQISIQAQYKSAEQPRTFQNGNEANDQDGLHINQPIQDRIRKSKQQILSQSGSTSNMNIDSARTNEVQGFNQQLANENNFFENFDYDKNQKQNYPSNQNQMDEYAQPDICLNNINDNLNQIMETNQYQHQQETFQNSQINIQQQSQDLDQKSNSKEKQSQQNVSKPKQMGLPQPYDSKVYYDFRDFPDLKWEPFANKELCPPNTYTDVRYLENGDKMERLMKGGTTKPILFDLQNTWLKGEQYAHILQNQDRYCQTFGIQKYGCKQHPESIYIDPKDGLLYFVEGATIGSDFGFPRLGIRKRFKWKKMNFTTDLPKRDPLVSYIVASAVKCEKFFPGSNDDGPVYRMHAVILKKRDPNLQIPYIGQDQTLKNESQFSPESEKDKVVDQPRSLHGRVLTKSTKLKQQQNNTGFSKQNIVGPGGTQNSNSPNNGQNQEKNFILCHVRRVMGKKEEEFDTTDINNLAATELEQFSQIEQQRSASKIPNKAKNKQDQVPIQFSEQLLNNISKEKKIPNLKQFHNMTLDQIKKMKIGPDGKPLSIYKIKKYILPHTKLYKDQSIFQDCESGDDDHDIKEFEEPDDIQLQVKEQMSSSIYIDSPKNKNNNKKRKNPPQPIDELELELNKDSIDIPIQSQTDQILAVQPQELSTQKNSKDINIEMMDHTPKETKKENQNITQNQAQNQHNSQDINTANPLDLGNSAFGGQNPYNNIDSNALNALLMGSNVNGFGLNNIGMNNFNGLNMNSLMLNQLGALQTQLTGPNILGNQNQNNLNQLLSGHNNFSSQNDLGSLQNQLLLQNLYNNNQNSLLGLGNLGNMNLNPLLQQNPLNNLGNMQLQQNLLGNLGQVGQNQMLSKLQDMKSIEQLILSNSLLNNGGGLGGGQNGKQDFQGTHGPSHSTKKRDSKLYKKKESTKFGDNLMNNISPMLAESSKDLVGVSPSLNMQNLGGGLLGSMLQGNYLNNSSGSLKRKIQNEQPNILFGDLNMDYLKKYEKDHMRRLSGHHKINGDPKNQPSGNGSPKSNNNVGNVNNFMKSPNMQPNSSKFAEQLNNTLGANNKRKISMLSNFGRSRLDSNIGAFKKFDSKKVDDNDLTVSPLVKCRQGEPSFGPESKQESNSVATMRNLNKSSPDVQATQNISKKTDSKFEINQSKLNKQGLGNDNNAALQQLQMLQNANLQQQLMNLPTGGIDQLSLANLNPQSNSQNQNISGGNNSNNFSQNIQNAMSSGGNFLVMNEQNNNKNSQNSTNNISNQLLQQQNQFPGGLGNLLYNQQLYQQQQSFLLNQFVQQQQAASNINLLDFLQQQSLLQGTGNDKRDSKLTNQASNKQNDNQQINQQINIIQNSQIRPVINVRDQLLNDQHRKDSSNNRPSGQNQSPYLNKVSSKKTNETKSNQLIESLRNALAPGPVGGIGQNQFQNQQEQKLSSNFGNNNFFIPPKQYSHKNSNVSYNNASSFGPRKSTDITMIGKQQHKYSITKSVLNNNHQKPHHNQSQQKQDTTNNKQSYPVSQDNRQQVSDKNLDSTNSHKQDLEKAKQQIPQIIVDPFIKIPQQVPTFKELQKSPLQSYLVPGSDSQQHIRRESRHIPRQQDNNNMMFGQHLSRNSSAKQINNAFGNQGGQYQNDINK